MRFLFPLMWRFQQETEAKRKRSTLLGQKAASSVVVVAVLHGKTTTSVRAHERDLKGAQKTYR